jgi:diguanylate cyclase (GGDEF)-like protein
VFGGDQMATLSEVVSPAVEVANSELNLRLLRLERRLARERSARLEAEAIAERGLRELYNKQQQLSLLETIATKANQSTSIDETLRFALIEVCRHTGWLLGHVHKLAGSGPRRLVSTPIWHANDAEKIDEFITDTLCREFLPDVGLPGRVLSSGRAAWVSDVTEDANFPRAQAARACGLRAGFAFPVLVGREVVAALEFYVGEVIEPDAPLLAVMAQIGTQLGRVIERSRLEDRLIHDASHDPLTGLPNRLLFIDRLTRTVAWCKRHPGTVYAVLFIDLDRFKLVNDSLGHGAGDFLLVEIGKRLQSELAEVARSGTSHDAGATSHTLARLGGDEFTILLEDIGNPSVAVRVAERIQESVRLPFVIDGQEVYTTASIGIASSATDYAAAEDILRDADLAMYRAKSLGRARTETYDHSLHQLAVERLKLESDLRRALRNREFVLHYQPIVALGTREIVGFEALARWQRTPTHLVQPGDFIAIAEETGLIVFIGTWVLREACATLAQLHRAFPRAKPLTMSVNVSTRQFLQPDFVYQVRQAVLDSDVDPRTVRLEVTESVTIKDPELTKNILDDLRAFGVRVGIDDFGTGYSSLSYLHRLPFDTLKIDRSFVATLQQNVEGREIIRTILDLAQNLKMDVVAEGTETEAHVVELRAMGCGFAQGYFFSKPLDVVALRHLLADDCPFGRAIEPAHPLRPHVTHLKS